jgi:hypothetical protein
VVGVLAVGVIAVASARGDSRTSRDVKGSPVSFRLANSSPVSGYDKMTVPSDGTVVYVAPRPIWSGGEVISAQAREGGALELTLNSEAARRVANLARESGDRLAVFVDGKLTSVGILGAESGRATITGLNPTSTESVLRLLNGVRPTPQPNQTSAIMTVVPAGVDGDLYTVDVFIQGVRSMRAYQVGLAVEGGTSGDLVREEVSIDEERADFVFSQLDYLAPADQVGGRAAGILRDGIVDRAEPGYLGTFAFRATPDASGTFQISIETDSKSLLADSQNEMMEFQVSAPASVTIGQAPTRQTDK